MQLNIQYKAQDFSEFELEETTIDLSKTKLRFYTLLLSSLFCFGNYFVFDNPSVLKSQLESKLNINSFEFGLLYSIYSIPNIILPLFSGYLIDSKGIRISILLFTSLVAVGQAVFALGVSLESYFTALLGRGIFGLGAESQVVSQSTITSKWFSSQELVMAFGINLCVSRSASVLNNVFEPLIYNSTGSVVPGFWIGFFVCVFLWSSRFF